MLDQELICSAAVKAVRAPSLGMSDEQEYEPFNMERDFEGGRFVGGEFLHEGEKKKRRTTKEEAIYGSFLEGGSSEEEGGGGRKRGAKGGKNKPINLSAAPRFVSGGTFGPGAETGKDKDGEGMDSDADEKRPSMMPPPEEDDDPAMRDLDSGMQFRRTLLRQSEEQQQRRRFGGAAQQLPASFGKSRQADRPAPATAAPRGGAPAPKADWERYTKGIGSKLLGKMMEKDPEKARLGQVIEVAQLGKNQGIGFGDFSAKTAKSRAIANEWSSKATGAASRPDAVQDVAALEMEADDRSWKRDFQRAQPKVVYKTAEEAADGGRREKIIDMTGKEARVLGSYDEAAKSSVVSGAAAPKARRQPSFMPELEHNVRMLVNLSEAALQNTERKVQQEKEAEERAKKEIDRLDALLAAEAKQIERLEEMNRTITTCRARMRPAAGEAPITMQELAMAFDGMCSKFKEEYVVFDLSSMLYAMAQPKLRVMLEAWNPLAEPEAPIPSFTQWRTVFARPAKEMRAVTGVKAPVTDNYTRLVVELFLPRARTVISTQWEPRQAELATRFLEAWKPLLPSSVFTSLLEQCVLPRLQREVEAWNPRQDPVPIHTWLHPWLPLLGARLEPLYAPLRHKLFKALEAWHPSDPSAHAILMPWRSVWEGAPLDRLLSTAIVPKLTMLLAAFVINPNRQELEPFQWVMTWQDLMPIGMLITLLEQSFFPKWFTVLHTWLRGSPNFEEVSRWYLGWKRLFPEPLQTHPRMKVQFSLALDMMNKAVSGEPLPPVPQAPPVPGATPSAAAAPAAKSAARPAAELSFKEVMQRFAEKRGVVFLPSAKRRHPAGKPVYSFGPVDVALDNDVIFAFSGGQWLPTSLEQLAELAGAK